MANNVVQQVDALIAYIDSLDPEDKVQEQREILPSSVRPTHYYVALTPDLVKNHTFQGRVDIDLKISKKVNEIVLNANEITFFSAKLTQNNKSQEINGKDIKIDDATEFATIPLKEEVEVGNATLSITFEGTLNDKMKGFYKSKYKRSNGDEAYCGCTQFEATDARKAFPCWDEPAVKATFTVELTVPKDLVCLSNMPESDVKINNNLRTIVFEKSPIMSTYLLAWIIGEFEYVESKTSRDILVRVWTTMGNKHKAEFACQVGCNCLDFYEKYFGIEYPLPKCDMIAIPDFAAGAMENWGLITYREVALLCDKDKASIRAKQYVAIVVCHELAHQWFGNLVTMEWWSQLWLNEGFACFMEYLSSDNLFPNWQMWNMFIGSEYNRAFELDGMSTSHSIEVEIKSAKQADEVFDAISYCKGACIIRMLQSYIGDDNFREGLSKYLNNFRYANAVTKDLWDFLGKQSNKPIANIMQNWTKEQGFPLIIGSRKGNKLTLKQTRYLSTGKPTEDQDKTVWNIPICAHVEGTNEILTLLLDARQKTFDVPEKAKWIHLNADSTGFYCVQYDEDMMKSLIAGLADKNSKITPIERVCLIRDTRALAEQGVENATVNLLKLIKTMKYETSYPVWDAVITTISSIKTLIDTDNKTKSSLNKIMRNVLSEIRSLGWEEKDNNNGGGDDDEKKNEKKSDKQKQNAENELLRPLIISALGSYEDKDIIKESLSRFQKYIKDPKSNEKELPASVRDAVYRTALREGGEEEYYALKKYYLTCDDAADKSWSLRALGVTKKEKLLEELLNWILTSDQVRPQDKVFPFRTVANNLAGREMAWQFLQKTWDQWFKLFDGGFLVQHLAKMPSSFVTVDKAVEVEKFYKTIDAPACARSIKQCIEEINKNAAWRERELKNITKWIEENCD